MTDVGRAVLRKQVSFDFREFTLEKEPMNVTSVRKPVVRVLVFSATEESTIR